MWPHLWGLTEATPPDPQLLHPHLPHPQAPTSCAVDPSALVPGSQGKELTFALESVPKAHCLEIDRALAMTPGWKGC